MGLGATCIASSRDQVQPPPWPPSDGRPSLPSRLVCAPEGATLPRRLPALGATLRRSKICVWSPDAADRARSAAGGGAAPAGEHLGGCVVSAPLPPARRRCGRDRVHHVPGRPRQIKLRYSEVELADVAAAARRAGLTPSGFAAEAALAAARGTQPPSSEPWREALTEVMAARAQVRRFGANVNQAVRALNATGESPQWLARAVALAARAVADLDEAAGHLARRLR